ncbi:hypothetical protein [Pseudoalteromonas sp. MMG012]|uniref:hypothetical protein n=1 Tax=Pseudoalteromonas sp. MMG012 TaxID=2822686 RepID=UPI001B3A49D7|nr:hypothetical protein [Pseudoalteromonas sp. MMG012]MBQ4851940.1 hypothetical protein [Pseudoalteromonas sp. MMG012]
MWILNQVQEDDVGDLGLGMPFIDETFKLDTLIVSHKLNTSSSYTSSHSFVAHKFNTYRRPDVGQGPCVYWSRCVDPESSSGRRSGQYTFSEAVTLSVIERDISK